MLKLHLISACNLPNVDSIGKSDPYVRCVFRGVKKKSKVVKDCLDPEWNQTLEWDLAGLAVSRDEKLEILVKDSDFARDRLLGRVDLPVKSITSGRQSQEMDLTLVDKDQRPTGGRLKIKVECTSPQNVPATNATSVASGGHSIGDAGTAGAAETGSGSANLHTTTVDRYITQQSSSVRQHFSDKMTKFQVRVRVVEARQLVQNGSRMSACRVQVAEQYRTTEVHRHNSGVRYDETFLFFFEKKPSQVWEMPVQLNVCDSQKPRSQQTIGRFQLDVGTIYDQPAHAFINKWLPLAAQDEQDSEVKGYLLVSLVVLGPFDECPDLALPLDTECLDREENLLHCSQIHLTPATLNISIFHAEDLPRMDAGVVSKLKSFFRRDDESSRQAIDPFIVVEFAGKQLETQVMMDNNTPAFMQQLRIGVQLPTFARQIKLVIKDWDRGSESDIVATGTINLSDISSTDSDGFLPSFGPTFVNFYGATREFSVLEKDNEICLNEGHYEGCAYRGRVLMSLTTEPGYPLVAATQPIDHLQQLSIDGFMQRKSYLLHCVFEDAIMINEVNTALEFEVSIGNHGNKFESSQMPSPSFTQPTNAVYDGCRYYFLPWEESKPCVTIPCQWEDISHRLYSLNAILKTIEELRSDIDVLKSAVAAKQSAEHISEHVSRSCRRLLTSCRVPLAHVGPTVAGCNKLDRFIHNKRRCCIDGIVKETLQMLQSNVDADKSIAFLEEACNILTECCVEPQNSMPDVIIWMLCEKKRLAYVRVPAHSVIYAAEQRQRGVHCGCTQSLKLQYPGGERHNAQLPCMLRVRLWLGLSRETSSWNECVQHADTVIFAETYENQMSLGGHWVDEGILMTRPKWSDAEGDTELLKESFRPPSGWVFDGDWFVDPEPSLFYEVDAGHASFLEDVFENQIRLPGGDWKPDLTHWSDVRKDPATPRDEREPPMGWQWEDAWKVDTNRAVDGEGWEYCVESSMGGYTAAQKVYHFCRRRRWLRSRHLVAESREHHQQKIPKDTEGWAYALMFGRKFHSRERKVDMVRRRRWHRQLLRDADASTKRPHDPKHLFPLFTIQTDGKDDDGMVQTTPMMYLKYSQRHHCHMRAHVYQARELHSGDKSGLSDPYACVSYLKRSRCTEHLRATVCPTWNQSIVFEDVVIYGSREQIGQHPPPVVVEIFDHDTYGKPEYLGRVISSPVIQTKNDQPTPALQWFSIYKGDNRQGELLASFELFILDENSAAPEKLQTKQNGKYCVPSIIRPKLQRTAVEILCWGVRNMKRYKLAPIQKPSIEFECSGTVVKSDILPNVRTHPNFKDPHLFMELMLPIEPLYMPPLNVVVRDHRMFGEQPVVGSHVIKSLDQYRTHPHTASNNDRNVPADADVVLQDGSVNGSVVIDMHQHENMAEELAGCPEERVNDGDDVLVDLADTGRKGSADPLIVTTLRSKTLTAAGLKGVAASETRQQRDNLADDNRRKSRTDGNHQATTVTVHQIEGEDENAHLDWWSKYYASKGQTEKCCEYLENGYLPMKVYSSELEEVSGFNSFQDILGNYSLTRGKTTDDEGARNIGEFRGTIRVYSLPEDKEQPLPPRQLRALPSSTTEEVIVRVYIVRCWSLCSKDANGLSDPYVKISLGDQEQDNRDSYRPNTLDPIFGCCMEFSGTLPKNNELIVKVMDYDLMSKDDLIGQTRIDLENRFMTRYRATCGLQRQYHTRGVFKWRDSLSPRQILEQVCDANNLPLPVWTSSRALSIGEDRYTLDDLEDQTLTLPSSIGAEDERLALLVLHTFDVVPEHVETRTLYNPAVPGIEQGKVEMFVDIFSRKCAAPGPPLVLSPRNPNKYVLRVVLYNVHSVTLQEYSKVSDSRMSDVYVKCWLRGSKDIQETDIHYRCMDGEAMFNWRFVFDIDYMEAEKTMLIKTKEHFWSLDETELRTEPKLVLQLWDNDLISKDDYLGELELDLCRMRHPATSAEQCQVQQTATLDDLRVETVNSKNEESERLKQEDTPASALRNRRREAVLDLWKTHHVRGFWPATTDKIGEKQSAGKLELDIELLTADQAAARPAARGREEPNAHPRLEPPRRPATSFLWFTSPWKSLRYIVWRRYRWYIITFVLIALLTIFLLLAFYSLPGAAVDKLLGL